MDINNKNELHTHQGMDLRQMQKGKLNMKKNTLLRINSVINDRLTCNVNKVYLILRSASMHFQLT